MQCIKALKNQVLVRTARAASWVLGRTSWILILEASWVFLHFKNVKNVAEINRQYMPLNLTVFFPGGSLLSAEWWNYFSDWSFVHLHSGARTKSTDQRQFIPGIRLLRPPHPADIAFCAAVHEPGLRKRVEREKQHLAVQSDVDGRRTYRSVRQ